MPNKKLQLNRLSVNLLSEALTDSQISEMQPFAIFAEPETLKTLRAWALMMVYDSNESHLWSIPMFPDPSVSLGYLIFACDEPGNPAGVLRPNELSAIEDYNQEAKLGYGIRENRQKPFGLRVHLC